MKAWIALLGLALTSGSAMACSFNTDCDIGSRCVKQYGELDGGKIFECERCGMVLWKTPCCGWVDLGRG